ncbi:MAG: alpha/beta hydrolase [Rhizobiales bacterium]|nr:alpha/beta hydrolase [Hyphomicrobiales bacterium]
MTSKQSWRDVHYTAADGTKLYARDYGAERAGRCPVLCLSGLTRNSREFHGIAEHLSRSRRVICPDYRGRGMSQFAGDPNTYTPFVEMADVVGLVDQLGIGKTMIVGTSRGGLIAMLMAGMHRSRLAGVVFNDIGPVIEADGLLRILPYVGLTGQFPGWPEAIDAIKVSNVGFDGMSEAEWDYFARFSFTERGGQIVSDHDPKLAVTMPTEEQVTSGNAPDLWPAFLALGGLPIGVVRGENSDFLSEVTVARMKHGVAGLEAVTIANRGHTPFLTEPAAMELIERTLSRIDASRLGCAD